MRRVTACSFPLLIILFLAAAAYASQVPAGLLALAALIMLYQGSAAASPDFLPGGPVPLSRGWRKAAQARELDSYLRWTASMQGMVKPEEATGRPSLTSRVALTCAEQLDIYEASLPSLPAWARACA